MCGQLGYSGKDNYDINKVKILALWNSLERGQDSTGFYTPKNGIRVTLTRAADVVVNPKFQLAQDKVMMGHFRWATVGNKVLANAHPFERGDYILQHNGTLENHLDLLDKYKLNWADFNVDSDIVCGCIEKCDDISQVLKEIKGPAAMIIHNKRLPSRLYIFKNKERPLFKGMIGANMYISSLEGPLQLIGCINIKEFKDDVLYTIEDGSIIGTRPLKNTPYKKPYQQYFYSNGSKPAVDKSLDFATHTMKGLGSWVRGATSCTFGKDFKMIKGDYYYVNDVVNANTVTIYCPVQQKSLTTHTINIERDDIILPDDYCKVLKSIKDPNGMQDILEPGNIVRCRSSYQDGELSLSDDRGAYLTIAKKATVRKLTPEELDEFLLSLNGDDYEEPSHEQQVPEETTPEFKPATNEEIEESEDDYYDLWLNNKDLSNHFKVMDFRLGNLSKTCIKAGVGPDIINRIVSLVKYNLKGFEGFTLPITEDAEASSSKEITK